MSFPEFDPEPSHLVYLILSTFLILYALFSELIKNRLHLSEPPLALLVGIIIGVFASDLLAPANLRFDDRVTQEITRMVCGIQVFTVGIDLPSKFVKRHWKSLALLLGPVMLYGWFVSAGILYGILQIKFTTALMIAATLTPTDPILSASVLGEARFSSKVPKRLRRLLSAESGCNDGSAYPILYAAIFIVTKPTTGQAVKSWLLDTIFWECIVGIVVGVAIGLVACKLLRFSETRGYVQEATLFVFYFLLAVFSVGVGSTLGLDDFLVAFSAGTAFAWDGWFSKRTHKMKLPSIIDLILNSTMFVYFGTLIPWDKFQGTLGVGKLIACFVLIIALKRLPVMLAIKSLMPCVHTYSEAAFAGHFGPIGVGALFLALETTARLETGSSTPLQTPPKGGPFEAQIAIIWPTVCFMVLGSIIVHGFSAFFIAMFAHVFLKNDTDRTPLISAETGIFYGMAAEEGSIHNTPRKEEDDDNEDTESE